MRLRCIANTPSTKKQSATNHNNSGEGCRKTLSPPPPTAYEATRSPFSLDDPTTGTIHVLVFYFLLQLTEDVLRSFGQALKDSVQRGDLRLDLSSEDSAGPPVTITPSAQGIRPAAAGGGPAGAPSSSTTAGGGAKPADQSNQRPVPHR